MRASGVVMVVSAASVLVLAGCSSGGEAAPVVTTTTGLPIAAEAPASFDPCTDIPQSVLDSENLRRGASKNANYDGGRGIKWRGCSFVAPDSYAVGITTTTGRFRTGTEKMPPAIRAPTQ